MLCGNKSDLRDDAEKIGKKVVKHDDGQRLARVNIQSNSVQYNVIGYMNW